MWGRERLIGAANTLKSDESKRTHERRVKIAETMREIINRVAVGHAGPRSGAGRLRVCGFVGDR